MSFSPRTLLPTFAERNEKARLVAEAANESEIAARNMKLMELYRAQKPCRDVQ
jgi:hypothetical protein